MGERSFAAGLAEQTECSTFFGEDFWVGRVPRLGRKDSQPDKEKQWLRMKTSLARRKTIPDPSGDAFDVEG